LYSTRTDKIDLYRTYKQGGSMTKREGATLNWARIENARMINKAINQTVKETCKNLREANAEL